jgi:hypothetical protein
MAQQLDKLVFLFLVAQRDIPIHGHHSLEIQINYRMCQLEIIPVKLRIKTDVKEASTQLLHSQVHCKLWSTPSFHLRVMTLQMARLLSMQLVETGLMFMLGHQRTVIRFPL